MKRAKKRKKPAVTMSQAELKRLIHRTSDLSTTQALCLFIAYIMEETEITVDDKKVVEIVDGVNRWADAVDDHLITLKEVAEIIEKHTGAVITW